MGDTQVLELFSTLQGCDSEEALLAAFREYLSLNFGVQQWTLAFVGEDHSAQFFDSTYPEEWVDHYTENNFGVVDPVVLMMDDTDQPFTWEHSARIHAQEGAPKAMWEEACDYGLSKGLLVPLESVGANKSAAGFAVNEDVDQQAINRIHATTVLFHNELQRIQRKQEADEIKLTRREIECLSWSAAGKTAWEISVILDIAERTVNFHLNSVRKKLRANNIVHAVALAISKGFLNL